jgi:phosphoribosylformylglycinamidine synthase
MTAKIYVTLKPSVLDPQGQAVARSLARLGFADVQDARIGKYIELKLDGAATAADLDTRVKAMCEKLLANTVIEEYRYELVP